MAKVSEGGLTEKQELFCQEYIKDLNATQAAIRAGYSVSTAWSMGWENLRKPEIDARIQFLQRERSARLGIDQDYVIKGLIMNLNRALERTEILDKKGRPIGRYRYDGAVANRALELLGNHMGMFRKKVELSGPNGGPVQIGKLEELSMEDLIQIARGDNPEPTSDPDAETTGGS